MLSYLYSLPLAALLWLLHFLPLTLLAPIGRGIGHLFYLFASRRRKIAALNIDWCFPELDQKERQALVHAHFAALGRSLVERALFWWASAERLRLLIHVEGEEKVTPCVLRDAQSSCSRPISSASMPAAWQSPCALTS